MEVLEQSNSRCFYCNRIFGWAYNNIKTVDHLWPISKGGNNSRYNKLVVCSYCNGWKANKSIPKFIAEVKSYITGNENSHEHFTQKDLKYICERLNQVREYMKTNINKMLDI